MRYFLTCFLIIFFKCTSASGEPADPKAYLQMIYENTIGYTIPSEEVDMIKKAGGHPQYGEIPYDSAAHILSDMNISRQDVFYDLGSGTGKLVIQVYLTTPIKRSIGVEISPSRWKVAESCRKQVANNDHLVVGRDLIFLNQDISKANFNDATICFISGITFPPPLIQSTMNRLSSFGHKIKVISILALPPHKNFKLIKTYNLPMSWAPEGVDVCLYQVTSGSQSSSEGSVKGKNRSKRR